MVEKKSMDKGESVQLKLDREESVHGQLELVEFVALEAH